MTKIARSILSVIKGFLKSKGTFLLFLFILISLSNFFDSKYFTRLSFSDWMALIGLLIGVVGIIMAIETNRQSNLDKLVESINSDINEIKNASSKRDLIHDNQIMELHRDVAEIRSLLSSHENLIGHPKLIEYVFDMKDKISSIEIKLDASTKLGEFLTQLHTMQNKIDLFQRQIADLIKH